MRGELVQTRQHMEQVLTLYDPQHHRPVAALYGQDPWVSSLSWLALSLWLLGYPDQALDRAHEMLALAQELGHPFSQGRALLLAPLIYSTTSKPKPAPTTPSILPASSKQNLWNSALLQALLDCGKAKGSEQKRGSCLVMCMVGSPRGLTQLTSKVPRRCWTSWKT